MKQLISRAGVTLAAAFLSASVQAATVTATFNSELFSTTIERTVDFGQAGGSNWYATTVGEFAFTRTGGTDVNFSVTTFNAFCIEPREFITAGQSYTYDVSPLQNGATNIGGMGAVKADQLAELFGRYYPHFGSPLNNDTAGALQIAAWEIVREVSGTFDVLNGNVRYRNAQDANALTLAQSYLSSLDGTGPRAPGLFALTLVGAQDVIVQAPEPGTLPMAGGMALAGLIYLRRKKTAAGRAASNT